MLFMRRFSFSLAAMLSFGMLLSCASENKSTVSVKADYLHIKGSAVLNDGSPAAFANIYLPGIETPVSSTDELGQISITLSDETLGRASTVWKDRLETSQATFNLILSNEDPSGQAMAMGMVRPLDYSSRGTVEVGAVPMGLPASISGRVDHLNDMGDMYPAAGVTVYAAHQQAITGEDGSFQIMGLPATLLAIHAHGDSLSLAQTISRLSAGQNTHLEAPLVVFSRQVTSGWITPMESLPLQNLIASGHPFQRSFAVSFSPNVKFMRYHHDRDKFDTEVDNWQPVQNRIDYDFPGNGGHSLYVQFANASKDKLSKVLTIQSYVNTFGDQGSVMIGDGSGEIHNRNASITVTPPSTAVSMRLHHTADSLTRAKWLPVANVTEYIFPKLTNPASSLVEIFVEFQDAQGETSVTYQASAILKIFPDAAEPVVMIENGAATHPYRQVYIDIQVPANAYEMSVTDSPPSSTSSSSGGFPSIPGFGSSQGGSNNAKPIWYPASNNFMFTFSESGLRELFVQFRDVDGSVSPIYKDSIRILPFDPTLAGDGFYINGGSPTTPTREVSISFDPPAGAVAFRMKEGAAPSNNAPWSALSGGESYVIRGYGAVTIYMQFQDIDQQTSYTYEQSIFYDPFSFDPGDFLINNGSGFTAEPFLYLDIAPPLAATAMRISDTYGAHTDPGVWQPVDLEAFVSISGMGTHTISISFRNAMGDESGYINRTVIYDPFPAPYGGFSINNGATSTTDTNVTLDFDLPPSAHQVTVSESPQNSGPWLVVENSKQFVLSDEKKIHTIYVQYKTIDGDLSPVFTAQIELEEDSTE